MERRGHGTALHSLRCRSVIVVPSVMALLSGMAMYLSPSERPESQDAVTLKEDKDTVLALREQWKRSYQVFCRGSMLHFVATYAIYSDDKTFVDKPLKVDPEEALFRFSQLGSQPTKPQVEQFLEENFDQNGKDLQPWTPADWSSSIPLLSKVKDHRYAQFACELNTIWKALGRTTSEEVRKYPQRHSSIALPFSFIVPGGRFQEVYCWDNYWIIIGLLRCGMHSTALGMIRNMFYLLAMTGQYVPNGSRVYYLERSQQPLLSEMVRVYIEVTGDKSIISEALDALTKEHAYFTQPSRTVRIKADSGKEHTLNVFKVAREGPRPESYRADEGLCSAMGSLEKVRAFGNIAASCESGWDFSSRWFSDPMNMTTIETDVVVPVDLNVFLYRLEDNIATFASCTDGMEALSSQYAQLARERADAIEDILYNKAESQWFDYDSQRSEQRKRALVSNYFPLWAGILKGADLEKRGDEVAIALESSGLLGPAGIFTTLEDTTQQWDYPNAWPPTQHLVIEGLRKSGGQRAQALAVSLAQRCVLTSYVAFKEGSGVMHEKYDARQIGKAGGGGEYVGQTGFGWTNGVVFDLLYHYGDVLSADDR